VFIGSTVSVLGQFFNLEERLILAQEQPHRHTFSPGVRSNISAFVHNDILNIDMYVIVWYV